MALTKKNTKWSGVFAYLFLFVLFVQAAGAENPPNILFILSDDHRWNYMSAAGHAFIQTPSLDRIANEGILFENAFVTSSLCSPSRASFLTGQYPQQHGVQNNLTPWRDSNVTFFEGLKARGYSTAFIGKWHMPGGLPTLRGVDLFISFDITAGQGRYYDTPYIVNGKRLAVGESPMPGVAIDGYITKDLTNFALAFIEQQRNTPFALYLSHKAAHLSMTPPEELAGKYANQPIELPDEADPWVTLVDGNYMHQIWSPLETKMRAYAETLEALDQQIGLILDKLDETGLTENTIVVYAGDNGYLWGEHRLVDKRWAYEESIRIPFLLRYPARLRDPGRRNSEMVLNIDLAPTLLELAGAVVPDAVQGKSLVPLLEDRDYALREEWLYSYFVDAPYRVPAQRALRTRSHILIDYQMGREDELFDLLQDPREKSNLLHTPAGRELEQRLLPRLEALEKAATKGSSN